MQTVQKQGLNIVLNEQGNPIALVYRSQGGDWIVYTMQKATQEELIDLLTLDRAGKAEREPKLTP